jgi:uncharacterized protein YeaO (DUF488 family)
MWYGHDPERFEEFGRRYQAELAEPECADALARLRVCCMSIRWWGWR